MLPRMIVVTGGAGFIGSNIVGRLCEQGQYDVVVCDRLGSANDGKWLNIAKHQVADFWSPEELFVQLERHATRIDAVIHMGAISATTELDADLILRTNFTLSRDLWDWCSNNDVRFVYASSAATYGDGSKGFEDDNSLNALNSLRPLNAYGYSKYLFDQYAITQTSRGHSPRQWAGLKFFNVYGPNEGHKGSMKSVVAQIWPKVSSGDTVSLFRSDHPDYEDGGQLRDFVFVDDIVAIIEWLLQHPAVNGVFNAGSGHARSFADLAKATFAAAGKVPDIEYVDMPAALVGRYQYFTEANMQRLREAGYERPMTSLEEGVRQYVQGFLSTNDPYR